MRTRRASRSGLRLTGSSEFKPEKYSQCLNKSFCGLYPPLNTANIQMQMNDNKFTSHAS